MEMFERFLTAVETLAAAMKAQAEILAQMLPTQGGNPAGEPAPVTRRRRKSNGGETAQAEPIEAETTPAEETAPTNGEDVAPGVLSLDPTDTRLNKLLQVISATESLGLPKAKEIFGKHAAGAPKLSQMAPDAKPALFKDCIELIGIDRATEALNGIA